MGQADQPALVLLVILQVLEIQVDPPDRWVLENQADLERLKVLLLQQDLEILMLQMVLVSLQLQGILEILGYQEFQKILSLLEVQ